jgi:hypothetical protein
MPEAFAIHYVPARARFLERAREAGAELVRYTHPMHGRFGESLTVDVARLGAPRARRALVITSGTHGVEGVCGSGIQSSMLSALDPEWLSGLRLYFVHAHNPHGFSWWRRTNEDNVDLNRNSRDFGRPLPGNPGYAAVHPWLVPADWEGPAREEADRSIARYVYEHGLPAWQAVVSTGQWEHADGLFYGGRGPTWSNRTIRRYVRDLLQDCEQVGVIDLHTGLGPRGHGELIYARDAGDPEHRRLLEWLGDDVTSLHDGSSSSAPVEGTIDALFRRELGDGRVTFVTLEYGTRPVEQVLDALRADNWLHSRGDPEGARSDPIKQLMRDAFWGDDEAWQIAVRARAVEVTTRFAAGLRARAHV